MSEGWNNVLSRFAAKPGEGPADRLVVEAGDVRDYHALAAFHYRGQHPGAVTDVQRMVHRAPTVVGRYLQRADETQVVAVLVRSLPRPACAMRDVATNCRFRGLGASAKTRLLNAEMRCISRVVVSPQWRGLGLAVKIVQHALEHPQTPYTEALAVMGRVHPFFERAGMTRYDRPPRNDRARLLDVLDHLGISVWELACPARVMRDVEARPASQRVLLHRELWRWYRAALCPRKSVLARQTMTSMLGHARDRLLAQPVYYLADHEPINLPETEACHADAVA
jgi:GNAT superfamily N-acetyltransferase